MSGKEYPAKLYPCIGCCGIDCGLCPRYYTTGASRCPGCYGPDFATKHPSCPFITCCVKKKGLEVCGQCADFPCPRFHGWDAGDSFVTHLRSISNLNAIKEQGQDTFIAQQKIRISRLVKMLREFDDGRSKSFYCLTVALLPLTDLEASLDKAEREIGSSGITDPRRKAAILHKYCNECANERGIDLKLRKGK